MSSLIGKGLVGDFYLATWKNRDVAVKILVNQNMNNIALIQLFSTAIVLSKLDHPNLLPLFGICPEPFNTCLVVEFMHKGSLYQILHNKSVRLRFKKIVDIAQQVALGMAYLTSHPDPSVNVHNNLKSHNILISENWEVKISDYGQSFLKNLAHTMTSKGDVAWTAPEVLQGRPPQVQSSVYSFGTILWEMCTREIPCYGENPIKVAADVIAGYRPPIPESCPPYYRKLIDICWSGIMEHRPSWDDIVSHLDHMSES